MNRESVLTEIAPTCSIIRVLEATMYDRISIDPNICHGQACVKGTRIPVRQIVSMLANGDTIENC